MFENINDKLYVEINVKLTGWDDAIRMAIQNSNYCQEEWTFTKPLYLRVSEKFSELLNEQLRSKFSNEKF